MFKARRPSGADDNALSAEEDVSMQTMTTPRIHRRLEEQKGKVERGQQGIHGMVQRLLGKSPQQEESLTSYNAAIDILQQLTKPDDPAIIAIFEGDNSHLTADYLLHLYRFAPKDNLNLWGSSRKYLVDCLFREISKKKDLNLFKKYVAEIQEWPASLDGGQ